MKVVKNEPKNVIELEKIQKHHSIVCRIGDYWCIIVRECGNSYCAIRLDNNTIIMDGIEAIRIRNLHEWYELSEEMHVFRNATELFNFMLD